MATPATVPVQTGYIDSAGHPRIKIGVYGLSEALKQEFEAIIDTGFTGFLMMPFMQALPLGLTLYGTGDFTLADGSTSPRLLALGWVDVEGEKTGGVIVLEGNASYPLLGMDFLRKCKKALLVARAGAILVDEDRFVAAIKAAAEAAEATLTPQLQDPPAGT